MAKRELPPSRELRLEDGAAQGFAEHVALSIYSGGTTELLQGIVGIELTIESQRANAARSIALLLKRQLTVEGYLVVSDIDECLETFLEEELMG